MKLIPERRVYFLGATLCVALTICSRNFGDRGGPYFNASWRWRASRTSWPSVSSSPRPDFRGASSSSASCWLRCGTFHFSGCPPARTMIFIATFGTAACSGSAITHILSFPAILPLRGLHTPKPAP